MEQNLRYLVYLKKPLFIFPLLLLCAFVIKRSPDHELASNASSIVSDELSNVYLIDKDRFVKYDLRLKFVKEFSNKNFGDITSADLTNPLRPLLFYREFGRIVFLDNTLSQNGDPVAMERLGYPLATLAASSHDNGLWIYDQPSFEMLRFDQNLGITSRSGNLSQILNIDLQPNFIVEKDNRVFLNNPSTGILVFDVFGTYMKTVPVKNLASFQVDDDNIIYYDAGQLHSWNIRTSEITTYDEPVDQLAIGMRIERDAIFVHDTTMVYSYLRKK